jgi:acetoin utilization protein AcuC
VIATGFSPAPTPAQGATHAPRPFSEAATDLSFPEMPPAPRLIAHDIYRRSSYGTRHPLSIPRVSAALDLIDAMGWLDVQQYIESPTASRDEICRFHDADYVDALIEAERTQRASPEVRRRFNFGVNGNPVFPEMFRRPATACGGTLKAAALLLEEGGIIHHLAGGTHHGRRDRASGFCFLNDVVLGILKLLDSGLSRVAYVDLDAHHGDGVEAAFAGDWRVLAISIHEEGRWPFSGAAEDRAGGSARNLPVPAGFNDSEMEFLIERAVLPLLGQFQPDALVIQCGADALADDPMSGGMLSNRAIWEAVGRLSETAPRLLVLGGGGYNPWSVARCWAGLWATLNRLAPDQVPTATARAVLRELTWSRSQGRNPPEHWSSTIADPKRPGEVRSRILELVAVSLTP